MSKGRRRGRHRGRRGVVRKERIVGGLYSPVANDLADDHLATKLWWQPKPLPHLCRSQEDVILQRERHNADTLSNRTERRRCALLQQSLELRCTATAETPGVPREHLPP